MEHVIASIITDVELKEIKKTIKNLKNRNAPGYNNITSELLIMKMKICLIRYPATLTKGVLRTQIFLTPLNSHNPNSLTEKPQTLPENRRPINLFPIPGKIIEKTLNTRIQDSLSHLIPPNQIGFRGNIAGLQVIATPTTLSSYRKKNFIWGRCGEGYKP